MLLKEHRKESDYKVEQNGVTLRLLLVIKIPSLKLVFFFESESINIAHL